MHVAITGGAGFLGTLLTRAILDRDALSVAGAAEREVETIRLLDRVPPPAGVAGDARVEPLVGDLAAQLDGGDPLRGVDLVVHLAAAVSGEAERDFDFGMANNLDASRALFESCRRLQSPPVLVFASSVAVFGDVPGHPLPHVITDSTLPIPRSSYGTQKFVIEQLLSDYTRRGYVRGRTVRLMTVTVRPGRPNAAASSFVSGIIREPLTRAGDLPGAARHGARRVVATGLRRGSARRGDGARRRLGFVGGDEPPGAHGDAARDGGGDGPRDRASGQRAHRLDDRPRRGGRRDDVARPLRDRACRGPRSRPGARLRHHRAGVPRAVVDLAEFAFWAAYSSETATSAAQFAE